jgi:hypothetical protein
MVPLASNFIEHLSAVTSGDHQGLFFVTFKEILIFIYSYPALYSFFITPYDSLFSAAAHRFF